MTDSKKPAETIAYQQWRKYHDGFYMAHNVQNTIDTCRRYYEGRQYADDAPADMPKPVMNICRDYVTRVAAKIVGTKRHVSFVADMEDRDLRKMDGYYEYEMNEIDDDEVTYEVVQNGFIDGIGLAVTTYDRDTVGSKGIYKGHLKRTVIRFDRFFFANPYDGNFQNQRYWGYYLNMEIGAVREMLEGDPGSKEYKEKDKLIVPEDWFDSASGEDSSSLDSRTVRVYFRFFRKDGEVCFEACTRYVDLYEHPHALNPDVNERTIASMKKKADGERDRPSEGNASDDTAVRDYETDNARYDMPSDPRKEPESEYRAEKDKFWRYPVSVFRPYPLPNSILGECILTQLIANQNDINLIYIYITLIMQAHASPKYRVKPDALNGQVIDNSPSQVLMDYSSYRTNGGGWGIDRLGSGDAVNSNLIDIGERLIGITRQIYGFNNIEADQMGSDMSGYAYQQMVKQMNITLEEPQRKLWNDYVKENARTDLMFFKHYVDNDEFFYQVSDSQVQLSNSDMRMYRNMQDTGKLSSLGIAPGSVRTDPAKPYEVRKVDREFFDHEFNVEIQVEQGIEGSEITESQHYNQIWSYIASGNIDADKIKVLVENDPAISRKLRASLCASLDELERGQLAQKDQTIQMLQAQIQQLTAQAQVLQRGAQYQQKYIEAQRKAAADQTTVARNIVQQVTKRSGQPVEAEGQVKSDNAKGIGGGNIDSNA